MTCRSIVCVCVCVCVVVLTVPDEMQCKPTSLISAHCLGCCPFVTYIVCVCVCVCACVRACACARAFRTKGSVPWSRGNALFAM